MPSSRPAIENPNCPAHIARFIFEKSVKLTTIKGYWYNSKTEKGLATQPLGSYIVQNYGCFISYLIRSSRHYRSGWAVADVIEYETNLLKLVVPVIDQDRF